MMTEATLAHGAGRSGGPHSAPPVVRVCEPHRTPLTLVINEGLDIGRDGQGLILLDTRISRRHLRLEPVEGNLFVSDVGSSNGSSVDGKPLRERHHLANNEIVEFGACTLTLATAGTAPHVPPRASRPVDETDLRATSIDRVAAAVLVDGAVAAPDPGTVTIVFSDIEGSTHRAVELGDVRWHEVLSVHNQIMRTMLVRHQGKEMHSLGDGFMMCFRSARSAIGFIVDAQRALQAWAAANPLDALRVRAGVHTGEAVLGDDGDLFGRHVVMASRIADQASGGEVLVSSLVREIVEPRGDISFGASRSVPLKGLGEHLVHQVVSE
jgi:class 3 adenylate cyclase